MTVITIIRKIFEYMGWVLLALVVLTAAFVMWGNKNGWEFDAVLSGSMEPVYNVGGLVVIRPVDATTLEVGSPISFKLPGLDTPICHRIIAVEYKDGEKFFQTQGDANENPDPSMVPLSAVTGKAVFHAPYVGRLAEFKNLGKTDVTVLGRNLPVAVLLVAAIGLLFIILTLKDIMEDVLFPEKKRQRNLLKQRDARLQIRKKALRLK